MAKKKRKKSKIPKKSNTAKKFINHDDFMLENLKDPKYASAYLDECLSVSSPERLDLVLDAFRLVAKAHGFAEISKTSGVPRRTLYDAFKKNGNPTAETLIAMLDAVGLSLSVKPRR